MPVTGITTTGNYTLMNYGLQAGSGSFSLSPTTAGVTTIAVGRTTYTLTDGAYRANFECHRCRDSAYRIFQRRGQHDLERFIQSDDCELVE